MSEWIEKAIKKLDILCATSLLQVEDGIPAVKEATRNAAKRFIKMIPLEEADNHLSIDKDGSVELELRLGDRTIFFTILNSGGVHYTDEYGKVKAIHGGFNFVTKDIIQQIIGGN